MKWSVWNSLLMSVTWLARRKSTKAETINWCHVNMKEWQKKLEPWLSFHPVSKTILNPNMLENMIFWTRNECQYLYKVIFAWHKVHLRCVTTIMLYIQLLKDSHQITPRKMLLPVIWKLIRSYLRVTRNYKAIHVLKNQWQISIQVIMLCKWNIFHRGWSSNEVFTIFSLNAMNLPTSQILIW